MAATTKVKQQKHRPKTIEMPLINTMVARLLTRQEVGRSTRAQQAVDAEVRGLEARGVWNLTSVREQDDVVAEARKPGAPTIHLGDLMTLCSEKHSELNLPEEERDYKGRACFRGDNV